MSSQINTNIITRVETKTQQITWTIDDISKEEQDTKFRGPEIYLTPILSVGIAFKSCIEKRKYYFDPWNHYYVYVCNRSKTKIKIQRDVLFIDCNGEILKRFQDSKIFTVGGKKCAEIVHYESSNALCLPNNKLIIQLSIHLLGQRITEYNFQSTVDPREKLVEDFKTMQLNAVNSDVCFQIGNKRIPAHWSVLSSRSPYFKKMFDSEMLERVENSITITDLSLYTLKNLIQFLYTADFSEDDLEELFNLYYAADKYEVLDLRTLCGSKIMLKATYENACRILQLSRRHNDLGLKQKVIDYIRLHSNAVFQTNAWKELELTEPLAAEFFRLGLGEKKF